MHLRLLLPATLLIGSLAVLTDVARAQGAIRIETDPRDVEVSVSSEVLVGDFRIELANANDIELAFFKLQLVADAEIDLGLYFSHVALVLDLNRNGVRDGFEPIEFCGFNYVGNRCSVSCDELSLVLPDQPTRVLLYFWSLRDDFSGRAPMWLDQGSLKARRGGQVLEIFGLPRQLNTLVFDPPPAVQVGRSPDSTDQAVQYDSRNVVVGDFTVTAERSMELEALRVRAMGSGDEGRDLLELRLVRDIDGDGRPDRHDHVLHASTFSENGSVWMPGSMLTGEPLLVGPAAAVRLLLVADFGVQVAEGSTFRFRIDRLITSVEAVVVGLPAMTPTTVVTDLVEPRLRLRSVGAPGVEARPGEANVPLAVLAIDGIGRGSELRSLTVQLIGGLYEPADVARVRLVIDRNRNGVVDGIGVGGGDRAVAQGVLLADDGAVTLTLANGVGTIAAGGSNVLIVAADLQATARAGELLGARVLAAGTTATGVGEMPLDVPPVVIVSASGDIGDTTNDGNGGRDLVSFSVDPAELALDVPAGCAAGSGCGVVAGWLFIVVMLTGIAVRNRSVQAARRAC